MNRSGKFIALITLCFLPGLLTSCASSGKLAKNSKIENTLPPFVMPVQDGTSPEAKTASPADTHSEPEKKSYKLVDKICAVVDSEAPILLSEVEKKSKELSTSNSLALKELLHERALRIYGRQLKFSSTDTHKAAEDHISTIMKNNNLTRQKFESILHGAPYFTTLKQYEEEIAFAILKNQIESSFANSIEITEQDIENAHKQQNRATGKEAEVVFITILPTKSGNPNSSNKPTTGQLIKANNIKSAFLDKKTLESVKMEYKDQKDVSFIGPVDYEEGALKLQYELELKKNPRALITEPFEDGRAVTMILRTERALSADMQKTALENVRNGLYEKAVRQRLDAVTKDILDNVPVEVNCAW